MQERSRKNRRHDGPRTVQRNVSFPEDIAEALDRAKELDERRNFSALVVDAVRDWLNRNFDRRAA
jgi:Arc/MetJ-type ribon-helix-helix transcriptional regulator